MGIGVATCPTSYMAPTRRSRRSCAASAGLTSHAACSWAALRAAAPNARCTIVAARDVCGPQIATIRDCAGRCSPQSVVLVTPPNLAVASALVSSGVGAIVWDYELRAKLPAAIDARLASCQLRRLATWLVGEESGIAPLLRPLIAPLAYATPPVWQVGQLAQRLRRHRRTLDRQWDSSPLSNALSLHDLLGLIALHRALVEKRPDTKWATIAHALRTDLATLSRRAHRLTGSSLRELSALTSDRLFAVVVERMRSAPPIPDRHLSRLRVKPAAVSGHVQQIITSRDAPCIAQLHARPAQ